MRVMALLMSRGGVLFCNYTMLHYAINWIHYTIDWKTKQKSMILETILVDAPFLLLLFSYVDKLNLQVARGNTLAAVGC